MVAVITIINVICMVWYKDLDSDQPVVQIPTQSHASKSLYSIWDSVFFFVSWDREHVYSLLIEMSPRSYMKSSNTKKILTGIACFLPT